MLSHGVTTVESEKQSSGPFTILAVCWMLGILLGAAAGSVWWWTCCALVPLSVMFIQIIRRRDRAARYWGLLTAILIGAAWFVGQTRYMANDDIRHFAGE